MHRIQVQLTDEQEKALRELATLRGASISALIREGVETVLSPVSDERRRIKERALAVIGKFRSGVSDAAERHDAYWADDIYEQKIARNRS